MSLVQRLKYAMYVLIVVTAVFLLTLSIAEGVGIVRSINVQALMFNPLYFLSVFGVGFGCAPLLEKRVPISGDAGRPVMKQGKQPFGYKVRVAGLVLLAIVLAAIANLAASLSGRFG